jgi:hypothetical protein
MVDSVGDGTVHGISVPVDSAGGRFMAISTDGYGISGETYSHEQYRSLACSSSFSVSSDASFVSVGISLRAALLICLALATIIPLSKDNTHFD